MAASSGASSAPPLDAMLRVSDFMPYLNRYGVTCNSAAQVMTQGNLWCKAVTRKSLRQQGLPYDLEHLQFDEWQIERSQDVGVIYRNTLHVLRKEGYTTGPLRKMKWKKHYILPQTLQTLDLHLPHSLHKAIGPLPKALVKLDLSGRCGCPLGKLPNTIREMRLGMRNFNHPLGRLPNKLEVLDIYRDDFNQPLGYLPPTLLDLNLGQGFNHALGPLPCNLIKLKLGDNFDQPLGQIPLTLQTLHVGHDFNHPLGLLPGTLKALAIGDSFDHPLGLLPATLETLEIGDSFDQPLGQLPGKLTILKIGYSFNQALDELPHSLKKLRLGEKFDHTVETLPRFIEVFEVGRQDMAAKYEKGMDGVEKDINKAIHLYEAKAKGGDLWAKVKTGFMYASIQKHSEAVAWFASAAGMDEEIIAEWRHGKSIVASAQGMLGTYLSLGEGIAKDEKEAVKWYKLAAEQGEASAQCMLGTYLSLGKGIAKGEKEAVKWYKLAAEQGNASAQFNLGNAYHKGEGIQKNQQEEVKWYRLAAEQGHVEAQYNLGVLYRKGEGVQKDETEATKWYKLAADQRFALAQHSLALMYAEGAGVLKDEKMAVALFEAAAAQGHASAKSELLKRKSTPCTAVRPPPPKKRRRGGLRRSDELDIELTQLRGTIGAQRKEVQAIETRIQANEARAEALEAKIKEAKRIEEDEDMQERAKAAPKKRGRGGGASSSAASNLEPVVGYSPYGYAHKEGINKVLMQSFAKATSTYSVNFDMQEARAFCLDGPEAMTTTALNRLGVTSVQIVNDDRHGDADAILQQIVDCNIQANAFKGSVCDFLSTTDTDARYNFILHDGHGWSEERAKEIDALLDHIAPICLFAVSVQIKGCGVACSHGPVQSVKVKQEPTSDEGGLRSTDVTAHTEIHRFSKIVTDKMAVKNITLRGPRLEYDAPGRDPRTVFKVLIWVLDAREMREHEHV